MPVVPRNFITSTANTPVTRPPMAGWAQRGTARTFRKPARSFNKPSVNPTDTNPPAMPRTPKKTSDDEWSSP